MLRDEHQLVSRYFGVARTCEAVVIDTEASAVVYRGAVDDQFTEGARKPRATGQISGVFMMGYGALRFVAEYFREPDDFLGLRALSWSQGQWLSLPMILAGLGIFVWATRRHQKPA